MPANLPYCFLPFLLLVGAATCSEVQGSALGVAPGPMSAIGSLTKPIIPTQVQALPGQLQETISSDLALARKLRIGNFVRRHRDVLDTDATGAPILRGEVVAIDPTAPAMDRARGAGFTAVEERTLADLDLRIVVLRSPRGTSTRSALRQLRRLDPAGSYDFNHVYFGSAADGPQANESAAPARATRPLRVGLIDSGVSPDHPSLAGVDLKRWGCAGESHPESHGTAVASLLVGNGADAGAPGAVLYAADIYCGRPTGGAVTGFVQAMAWMAHEQVGVINLSLVGPPNQLLERATRSLVARGHVLVAAVGNDGPAAPDLYPASYPMVIGVTAVDHRRRVLPEAARGQQVDFAALGSELRVASPSGDWGTVRGTSFAAALIARAAAQSVSAPGEGVVSRVYAQLSSQCIDLGPAGRDNTYGQGLLLDQATATNSGGP